MGFVNVRSPGSVAGDPLTKLAMNANNRMERNIEPHVALWDKSERTDGTFSRSDFIFDVAANAYTCPGGKLLQKYRRSFAKPRIGITKDNTLIYNASQRDCAACSLKAKCCPGQPRRKIARSIHEAGARCSPQPQKHASLSPVSS